MRWFAHHEVSKLLKDAGYKLILDGDIHTYSLLKL
jgi:hypothetical protein